MNETEESAERSVGFDDDEAMVRILGPRDSFLRRVRDAFDVRIVARGRSLSIVGPQDSVADCEGVLEAMRSRVSQGRPLDLEVVEDLIRSQSFRSGRGRERAGAGLKLEAFLSGRFTKPRSPGQAGYVQAMLENDIVFCIGPAGTGKTYLAVAVALDYMRRGVLKRIVLCRPAVEAGEHLGYLPGDIRAKVNPYLRPLYDALHDLMDPAQVRKYVDNDLIEILPMAFVRGRTLDHSFIILDEAQNCTVDQMKTFLTRLGATARLVVTGDITQVDLPHDRQSGLVDVQARLAGIAGIRFVWLGTGDIVRHRLVREIVNAYQKEPSGEPGPTSKPLEGDSNG